MYSIHMIDVLSCCIISESGSFTPKKKNFLTGERALLTSNSFSINVFLHWCRQVKANSFLITKIYKLIIVYQRVINV